MMMYCHHTANHLWQRTYRQCYPRWRSSCMPGEVTAITAGAAWDDCLPIGAKEASRAI